MDIPRCWRSGPTCSTASDRGLDLPGAARLGCADVPPYPRRARPGRADAVPATGPEQPHGERGGIRDVSAPPGPRAAGPRHAQARLRPRGHHDAGDGRTAPEWRRADQTAAHRAGHSEFGSRSTGGVREPGHLAPLTLLERGDRRLVAQGERDLVLAAEEALLQEGVHLEGVAG